VLLFVIAQYIARGVPVLKKSFKNMYLLFLFVFE